jgi:alkanesulfonate monooxygenase SsuD/methylene tetrahydromethanopterin reductase-like flavin-dependent oxidoreductase (luciferase family)
MPQYERIFEAMTTLVWTAAHTESIRLGTSVLVLAQRDPILAAKQLASIDVLCGGQLIVGIGPGYVAEEFGILGARFEHRGALLEHQIAVMRALWGGATKFSSGPIAFENAIFGPTPIQGAALPLWLAGTSDRALIRVAKLADAWHPAHLAAQTLANRRERLQQLAGGRPIPTTLKLRVYVTHPGRARIARHGTSSRGQAELAGTTVELREQLNAYEEAGVEELVVALPHVDTREFERDLESFAADVIATFSRPS